MPNQRRRLEPAATARQRDDESGQLLSTLHGRASPRHEDIIWLDQTPIARIDSTAAGITRADLIHSDHLNSPRA